MSFFENHASDWIVLIVDDQPDNLGVPEAILSFHGADVHTASDGIEGLAFVEKTIPTFILLDLSMPNMDGWEMLSRLRADPRTENILVIALTAHAMDGDAEVAMAKGFNGYITKPFFLNTFEEEIEKCLAAFIS